MTWQRYRGQPNKAICDAHTRLGPVVRLELTEISVNSEFGRGAEHRLQRQLREGKFLYSL